MHGYSNIEETPQVDKSLHGFEEKLEDLEMSSQFAQLSDTRTWSIWQFRIEIQPEDEKKLCTGPHTHCHLWIMQYNSD
jgi:hypothetical protein